MNIFKFLHRYFTWFFMRKDWVFLTSVPTNRTIWVNPGCEKPTNCEIVVCIWENKKHGYFVERKMCGRVV